jgi:pyruvate/2-oxoglutarate dehydrogenase complex dihydrolipoamide acyltransferase (E2) component
MKVIAADAGQVRSIAVSPGDTVRAGDVLVVIDSTIRSRTAAADSEALRASSNGIVGNVDVRPGQSLKAGDQVMSIVESSSGYDVIAFLPYSYAVELHQGMAMRLTMPGESISGHTVPISRVGPEVLDPTEAAQYAGKSDAATFPVAGRVILVRASLPVVSSDRSASLYRDGVTGKAEIRVSSESAIVALIPGLRKIFGKAD